MSQEDRVDELEKDTQVSESTPNNSEEQITDPVQPDDASQESQSQEEPEKIDWEARAKKAEEVAENYKRENEKYRKKDRTLETADSPPQVQVSDNQETLLKHDFASKKHDVIDELREDINGLNDSEWGKIKHLVTPAVNQVLDGALKNNRYVARGEIKRAVTDLLSYARGESTHQQQVEQARVEGIAESQKAEQAEISGVKSSPRPKEPGVISQDKQRAERTGRTPEQERDLRLKREERQREYTPSDPVSKYLNR